MKTYILPSKLADFGLFLQLKISVTRFSLLKVIETILQTCIGVITFFCVAGVYTFLTLSCVYLNYQNYMIQKVCTSLTKCVQVGWCNLSSMLVTFHFLLILVLKCFTFMCSKEIRRWFYSKCLNFY